MKVILINGSPHTKGCTFTALQEVEKTLKENEIETEIFQLGAKPIPGCRGCRKCAITRRCVIDDIVNMFIDISSGFDGYIFGSPVHYAAASGAITSFLDRVFYAGGENLRYKPGASIVSCRRAGSTASLDQLNKYFTINNMPVVSSHYWNMVHGFTPDDVMKDLEGMQIMRKLGSNMAWLLHCIQAGKEKGVSIPQGEERIFTNYIR